MEVAPGHEVVPGHANPTSNPHAVLMRCAHALCSCAAPMRGCRALYSNPPVHGARIVAEAVGNADMFALWKQEMEMMAGRIKVGCWWWAGGWVGGWAGGWMGGWWVGG